MNAICDIYSSNINGEINMHSFISVFLVSRLTFLYANIFVYIVLCYCKTAVFVVIKLCWSKTKNAARKSECYCSRMAGKYQTGKKLFELYDDGIVTLITKFIFLKYI